MRFRKLEYFIAVAEELHFGKAAARLHIAQPPLSQQIRNLEEDLGAALFERTSQRVSLTEAGAALLPEARALLSHWEKTRQTVHSIATGREGPLSVRFVWAAGTPSFSRGIAEFKRRRPKASLWLEEASTTDAIEAVRVDRADIAFIFYNPSVDISGLAATRYEEQGNMLALPEGHRLASMKAVPLKELRGEGFIMFARNSHPTLYDRIMNSLHAAGITPDIVQVTKITQTTRALVAAGMGIAIVPESTRFDQRDGLVYRPIIGKLPKLDIRIIRKTSRETPLMRRFIEHMLDWKAHESESGDP